MNSNLNLRNEINTNSMSVLCINISLVRRDILLVLYKVCSRTFLIYLLGLLASVTDGSWAYVSGLICQPLVIGRRGEI